MKDLYEIPKILIEELKNTDVLCASAEVDDNRSVTGNDLISSIVEDFLNP